MKNKKTLSLLCLAPLLLTSCSNSSKEEYIEWLESHDTNIVDVNLYLTSYYDSELNKYMIAIMYNADKSVYEGTNKVNHNFLYAVGPQKSKDEFAIDFTSKNSKYYLYAGFTSYGHLFQVASPDNRSHGILEDIYSSLPNTVHSYVLAEFYNKFEVTFTKRSFDDSKSYEVNKNKRENDFAEQTWTIKCDDVTYVTRSSGRIISKTAPKESIYTYRYKSGVLDGINKESTFDDATDLINKKLKSALKTEEEDGLVNVWANN